MLRSTTFTLAFLVMALMLLGDVRAAIILSDFETGTFEGWTSTGAWLVGGSTGTSPNVDPFHGDYFARSGEPNTASEAATGTFLSPLFTMTHDTLTFATAGWSSSGPGDGTSYIRVLDALDNEVARVATAQSDSWVVKYVDLMAAGLQFQDSFRIEAVDNRTALNYSWIALDDVRLTGAIPEPSTILLLIGAGAAMILRRKLTNPRSG